VAARFEHGCLSALFSMPPFGFGLISYLSEEDLGKKIYD
jgi:hypothetical protein